MRAYERYPNVEYDHPEDMEKILTYLNSNGKLNIFPASVERLYREFSIDVFYEDWAEATDVVLDRFADWLDDYEL